MTPLPPSISDRLLAIGVVLSLAALGGVFVAVAMYKATPGAAGTAPARWPAASAIARPAGLPTLVMFAHPHCPCTRASLAELHKVVVAGRGRVSIQVWFGVPGDDPAWGDAGIVASAEMSGVRVFADRDGVEAHRFGARTSGFVVLYDAHGNLRFQGGITGARGHEGDNAGELGLMTQLGHLVPAVVSAPVFGCALIEGVSL